jgi:hypothetical protein
MGFCWHFNGFNHEKYGDLVAVDTISDGTWIWVTLLSHGPTLKVSSKTAGTRNLRGSSDEEQHSKRALESICLLKTLVA